MKKFVFILLSCVSLCLVSCQSGEQKLNRANKDLGTAKKPIKMYFVPSMEAGKVVQSGEAISKALNELTGLHFKVAVPTSYAAVVEALGSNQADIAWLSTYAYILAHQKFGAEVKFMTVRNGLKNYRGQFIARADSGIESIEDLQGKVIAYTDAASTSGYVYPSAILKQKNIVPKSHTFVGSHPSAVISVYNKNSDAGCTYWSPPDQKGVPMDAREKLLDTYPDVLEQVKIIGFTEWIPNDTVTFRKSMPPEILAKITNALQKFSTSSEGQKVLKDLYDIDGLERQ